jgi:ATP-dependent helicase HrpB
VVERARRQAERYRKLIGVNSDKGSEKDLGILLALAYPERVGKRREQHGIRYQLTGGTGAVLPRGSMLSRERYLAVGEVDGVGSDVRILLAAPISEQEIVSAFGDHLVTHDEIHWDETRKAVVGRRVTTLGAVELSEVSLTPSQQVVNAVLIEAIRRHGLDVLPWTKESRSLKERSEWLRRRALVGSDWPVLSDDHLLATLDEWLAPFIMGMVGFAQLQRLDMGKVIRAQFSHEQLRLLDRLAPTHLTVPTGSRIPLDYTADPPVLAVYLQEMFGEHETPAIAGGKVKVMLHLLSPARRPLAVTQDLPSFWQNAYMEVRKDMRGRYPKHEWPENPLHARPTKRKKLS